MLPIDGVIFFLRCWAEFYRSRQAEIVVFVPQTQRRVRACPEGQVVQFAR